MMSTSEREAMLLAIRKKKRKNKNQLKKFVKSKNGTKSGIYTRSRKNDKGYDLLVKKDEDTEK
ncbi:hypothetical protein Hs30E_04420 [Lactococcus hodotermopsidis]|uniref:Uncharacterized protein n=1 Tax=Pseudolactococcus hodotermopsidis TaxID=2709157 RepID=A0A6A0BBP4_9LACT|nr:hypothetical protein [Lactococcus hodotermopsidis]GFH41891.1 hypothetical protein Hs30E_04420 [Lactococcus hodotermopsidis]